MKARIKKGLILLLAAAACLSLCGCRTIDDLNSNRADYSPDNPSVLTYHGQTYTMIPSKYNDLLSRTALNQGGYAAEEDMPCLLLPSMALHFYTSRDGTLLQYNGSYFCLDGKLGSLVSRLENNELNRYCVYSWFIDPDDPDEDYSAGYVLIDDRYSDMLDTLLKLQPDGNEVDRDYMDWYSWEFCRTDEEQLLIGDYFDFASATVNGKTVYYIWLTEAEQYIPIPESNNTQLEQMFDSCGMGYGY